MIGLIGFLVLKFVRLKMFYYNRPDVQNMFRDDTHFAFLKRKQELCPKVQNVVFQSVGTEEYTGRISVEG